MDCDYLCHMQKRGKKISLFGLLLGLFTPVMVNGQEEVKNDALSYRVEAFGSVTKGDYTPFWMVSNRYGVVPLDANNGYLKAGVFHQQHFGKGFRWGAGLDLVAAVPRQKNVYIHQLYAEIGYKCLELRIGSKEDYRSLLNPYLSSGDMIFSNNARPIPEVNFSIPHFTVVPLTKGWLQVKGNFNVGRSFENDFLEKNYSKTYFVKDALWHYKSFYLRLKDSRNQFPLSATVGLKHIARWGGTSTNPKIGEQPHSLKDFIRVFFGSSGGEGATLSDQINVLGAHHIGYDFDLCYESEKLHVRGYYQHIAADKSGLRFNNETDGLWGMEISLPAFPWLQHLVFEYVNTRNQSGPFHFTDFDHDKHPGRGGGSDGYYNNGEYTTGNSYFARGIGNPLIISPEYNENGLTRFQQNRIRDWHLGFQGSLSSQVDYRIKMTVMNSWGEHYRPFLKKKDGVSLYAEVQYQHPGLKGWEFSCSVGADTGNILGRRSAGFGLSVRKNGLLKKYQ